MSWRVWRRIITTTAKFFSSSYYSYPSLASFLPYILHLSFSNTSKDLKRAKQGSASANLGQTSLISPRSRLCCLASLAPVRPFFLPTLFSPSKAFIFPASSSRPPVDTCRWLPDIGTGVY
ncbi:hypothetical protein NW754_008933 [Fusarium falciforme]|nr:hypothetical protein NW754_008933 [Fusarium falciforme]